MEAPLLEDPLVNVDLLVDKRWNVVLLLVLNDGSLIGLLQL